MKLQTIILVAAMSPAVIYAQDATTKFEFSNPEELRSYFKTQQYDLEHWGSGDRTVPRLYLDHVPERWRKNYADKSPTDKKKEFFFFVYAPIVLEANEDIAKDRMQLQMLAKKSNALDASEKQWMMNLAKAYQVQGDIAKPETINELLARVDEIPASLTMAQAATESGWGTSRFADLGNALFGQWTWSDDGITPTEQRTATKGNYKIKSFPHPVESVAAYMRNLNTHPTYKGLRDLRVSMRAKGEALNGEKLAAGLDKYSERGMAYVEELQALIRKNKLALTDNASLRNMQPVMLVPVGEGSE